MTIIILLSTTYNLVLLYSASSLQNGEQRAPSASRKLLTYSSYGLGCLDKESKQICASEHYVTLS